MAATKLQLNWTGVSITPSGGSLTSITKVTNIAINSGGSLLSFAGDNDRYPTTVVNAMNNPGLTITSGDIGTLLGFPIGTVGVVAATHADAKAATSGSIAYSFINSVVQDIPSSGAAAQFGTGSISLLQFSSDGPTNPTSFTRV